MANPVKIKDFENGVDWELEVPYILGRNTNITMDDKSPVMFEELAIEDAPELARLPIKDNLVPQKMNISFYSPTIEYQFDKHEVIKNVSYALILGLYQKLKADDALEYLNNLTKIEVDEDITLHRQKRFSWYIYMDAGLVGYGQSVDIPIKCHDVVPHNDYVFYKEYSRHLAGEIQATINDIVKHKTWDTVKLDKKFEEMLKKDREV